MQNASLLTAAAVLYMVLRFFVSLALRRNYVVDIASGGRIYRFIPGRDVFNWRDYVPRTPCCRSRIPVGYSLGALYRISEQGQGRGCPVSEVAGN
jgi:hypothetical protein